MRAAIGDEHEESYATAAGAQSDEPAPHETMMMEMETSSNADDGDGDGDGDKLTLPDSTHSFLFTEPPFSPAFLFGVGIALITYTCLILALVNNLNSGSIPANVQWTVRIAQYLSILIALLMEEEIPTGLFLLRRISKPHLNSKFPEISYPRFVSSSLLRITMGYLFLINVVVVLVQADGVIDIFYDVLALEFIQKLDDIGFRVSKMEVLGKRLQCATMTPYFRTTFQRERRTGLGQRWRVNLFLKAAYFINLAGFLIALIVVSANQVGGRYQCESISVRFGDEIWQDAIVQWPSYSLQYPPGLIEEMVLVYTYFNGEYAKHPNRTQEGRPVYIEQKKSDGSPFDEDAPWNDPYHTHNASMDSIKPAEIKYCEGHWIFSHEFIKKSHKKDKSGKTECDWLARSPETDGFDLLDLDGKWQVWTGVITESEISIQCNKCSDNADCNLNGVCNSDHKCVCDVEENVTYMGTHCEVKLQDNCRTIIGEEFNDTWSVSFPEIFSDEVSLQMEVSSNVFQEYSRPVYIYISGLPESKAPGEGFGFSLIYSGSRWFQISIESGQDVTFADFWTWQTTNYHAFWARAYWPGITTLVSESTYNDSPVGVDFYHVGERGSQFGPFGLLIPAQKHNMAGRGVFRCQEETCSFCSNRITINRDYVIPDDYFVVTARGNSCGFLLEYSEAWDEGSDNCKNAKMTEQVCCPP